MWRINTPRNVKSQKAKVKSLNWEEAKDIRISINKIVKVLDFQHVDTSRIFCYRTFGSKSRSYARIWQFPKIFQRALNVKPAYVVEVLAKHFDKLDENNKKRVLIHELLHIPKNFSGALVPHRGRGGRSINKLADKLFKEYKAAS